MKNCLIITVLLITLGSCNNAPKNMTEHLRSPIGGTFYTFKGKIVGQDSLRWDIDLSGDGDPEIFAIKEHQNLQLNLNDSVDGDDVDGHYIIRHKH